MTQITLEEHHSDSLAITDHPVEVGAEITDHAYKRPERVTLKIAWTNSCAEAAGNENYVQEIYERLLDLQASREPIDIYTGKRKYSNMLIEDLSVTTDATTETALVVTASCRQVIIVQTRTTSVPPDKFHLDPRKTGSVVDRGLIQAVPVPDSVLNATTKAGRKFFGGGN